MAFGKYTGLKGMTYSGGGPMLAWLLHRIGGLAMVIFISMHIVASFGMQQFGSDLATTLNIVYESWIFQIVLYFFVIHHSLNGLRIIFLDFWPQYLVYQREAMWVQWILLIPIYGLAIFYLFTSGVSGG